MQLHTARSPTRRDLADSLTVRFPRPGQDPGRAAGGSDVGTGGSDTGDRSYVGFEGGVDERGVVLGL